MDKILLNKQGLIIPFTFLKPKEIRQLYDELTVKPKQNNVFDEDEDCSFKTYLCSKHWIRIPRYYPLFSKWEFIPDDFAGLKCKKRFPIFIGKVRDYQKPIVDECYKKLITDGGGIISMPCGRGKTVVALKLISMLNVKTLIVVHKTFLQNQWMDRINQFMIAKVGLLRQDHIDVKGKQIVITMLQSFSMRDYDLSIFKSFGLVIYDEVHRVGSKVFSKALMKAGARYTLGLSATPERKDGMMKIIKWNLGDIIYKETQKGRQKVVIKQIYFSSEHPDFKERRMYFKGKFVPAIARMINSLCKVKDRNILIATILQALVNQHRKILILSERRQHLTDIKKLIDDFIKECPIDGYSSAYYIGGMKEADLNKSSKAQVIFGTFSMAQEGLDIPELNTLMMITPKSSITQPVGRILRKTSDQMEFVPLIIDFVDDLGLFKAQGRKRRNYYISKKYKIENYDIEGLVYVPKSDDFDKENITVKFCEKTLTKIPEMPDFTEECDSDSEDEECKTVVKKKSTRSTFRGKSRFVSDFGSDTDE
jgi:superfamily II DNA or RNA helicase